MTINPREIGGFLLLPIYRRLGMSSCIDPQVGIMLGVEWTAPKGATPSHAADRHKGPKRQAERETCPDLLVKFQRAPTMRGAPVSLTLISTD